MVVKPLTGEQIEELKGLGETHFWPHSRATGDMSDDTGIKLVTHSKGIWVEGPTGERHVDLIAGMWLKNIGHGRKEITEAVSKQLDKLDYHQSIRKKIWDYYTEEFKNTKLIGAIPVSCSSATPVLWL